MPETSPAAGQVLSGLRGDGVRRVHLGRQRDQTERWTHGAQPLQSGSAGGASAREGGLAQEPHPACMRGEAPPVYVYTLHMGVWCR